MLPLAVESHLLVLIGGGEFSFGETDRIDRFLLANLPADRKKVAFLPTASGSADYATHLGKHFQELDADVETVNVPIYRGRDVRRRRNLEMLAQAGMIYIGGGVTNNVLVTLRESPAETALREAASGGAIIAAIGAAASCFGEYARDMCGGTGSIPALGWLSRAVVEAPFDPASDGSLRRLMSMPVDVGVGIPPRVAIALHRDGRSEIIGDGNIAVFRKE